MENNNSGQLFNQPPIMPEPLSPSSVQAPGQLPSISVLFSDSFTLMQRRMWVMFCSFLLPLVSVLGAVIVTVILLIFVHKLSSVATVSLGVVLGVALFLAYLYSLLWGKASQYTALRDEEENTGVRENLKRGRPLIWSLLLVSLIYSLIVMGGMMLFIVPGIILSIRYGLATMVMVVEGKKGRMALAQSKAYVLGRSWKVFGRVLLLNLAFLVPYTTIQIWGTLNKGTWVAIVILVLAFLLQIVFAFYSLSFAYVLYMQLKNSAGQTKPESYIKGVTGWTIWGCVSWVLAFVIFAIVMVSVIVLSLKTNTQQHSSKINTNYTTQTP